MSNLYMQATNMIGVNIVQIRKLFPNCLTEVKRLKSVFAHRGTPSQEIRVASINNEIEIITK